MSFCFVIAEAGVNHNGSLELALELIDEAANSGADAIKFQSFKTSELVSKGAKTAEYQQSRTGIDDQYSMLKKLEMSEKFHQLVIERCKKRNIEFMSTPFDTGSAKFLIDSGMGKIKIPSGELTNLEFLKHLAQFDTPLILSTGMSSLEEVKEAVKTIDAERKRLGLSENLEQFLTVLHCTSNYPARNEDVNLKAMRTMGRELNLPVGYSDHTDGILVPIAAVACGATVIEKHFTLDAQLEGPDHKASLEPGQFSEMIRQIRQIEICLGDGVKAPRDSELPVRDLVRRSVTLTADLCANKIIMESDIVLLRPGTGIPPRDLDKVIGRRLKESKRKGTQVTWQDLTEC